MCKVGLFFLREGKYPDPMKLGVLETGPVLDSLQDQYGPYTEFFRRLVASVDPDIEIKGWKAYEGELPERADVADGWMISGSKYGAYENLPWIPPLEVFLRSCLEARIPVAGFCFGHQILAQAAGGKVVKSDKGWGLGVHDYEVSRKTPWMSPDLPNFSAMAVHQDQVVTVPKDATVIARSEFCENAALAYGDPDKPIAISVQPHPEFNSQFMSDLVKERRGTSFPEDASDRALRSLDRNVDNEAWAKWVVGFFKRALET